MKTRWFATVTLGTAALAGLRVHAQSQSLAFTGGVLLNPRISFHNLGPLGPSSAAGPATGAAVNRTYDDGYNRVDADGNKENATGNWGYSNAGQLGRDHLVMSAPGGAAPLNFDDAGDFLSPAGNLEYRGSMGALGNSDWGILLSIGYQSLSADRSGTYLTDAYQLHDSYGLNGLATADLPAPGYAGTSSSKSPRIGSVPTRSLGTLPGGRTLSGNWDFSADLIPIGGGLYVESQLLGRLNGIAAAGVFAAFVNADLRFTERSTVGTLPTVTTRGGEGSNDVIYGGFVQLGLDWALWENASLVASARWQPAQEFNHSVAGREASVDFLTAMAVHLGFSLRF